MIGRLALGLTAALLGFSALAQTPAPPPAGGRAGQGLRPGFQLPPENSGGLYAGNGEPIFKARCASCHEPAVERAPSRAELGAAPPRTSMTPSPPAR